MVSFAATKWSRWRKEQTCLENGMNQEVDLLVTDDSIHVMLGSTLCGSLLGYVKLPRNAD